MGQSRSPSPTPKHQSPAPRQLATEDSVKTAGTEDPVDIVGAASLERPQRRWQERQRSQPQQQQEMPAGIHPNFPGVRQSSPEVRRQNPEVRRQSPEVRRQSPEVQRRSPGIRNVGDLGSPLYIEACPLSPGRRNESPRTRKELQTSPQPPCEERAADLPRASSLRRSRSPPKPAGKGGDLSISVDGSLGGEHIVPDFGTARKSSVSFVTPAAMPTASNAPGKPVVERTAPLAVQLTEMPLKINYQTLGDHDMPTVQRPPQRQSTLQPVATQAVPQPLMSPDIALRVAGGAPASHQCGSWLPGTTVERRSKHSAAPAAAATAAQPLPQVATSGRGLASTQPATGASALNRSDSLSRLVLADAPGGLASQGARSMPVLPPQKNPPMPARRRPSTPGAIVVHGKRHEGLPN